MTSDRERRRLRLFLRAEPQFGVEERKQEAVDRITDLARRGEVDDYEVTVWGSQLRTDGPLAATAYHRELRDRLREFREWASEHGASFASDFEEHTVSSRLADESYRVVSLPTLCLAVYEGDDLVGVYPCHDGEKRCTVTDYLESLERERRAYA